MTRESSFALCFYFWVVPHTHSGPENLKKSRPKNSWNQINQFHEIFFDQIPFFEISKNDHKLIFELGKSLKLSKMQVHEKKFWFDVVEGVPPSKK